MFGGKQLNYVPKGTSQLLDVSDTVMVDFWGKLLSLKAASGVCNIYKSGPHVKKRENEKRAQFGARRRPIYPLAASRA